MTGLRIDLYHHMVPDDGLAQSIESLRSLIVTSNADLTAQLNAAADQAEKSKAEVVAAVGKLTQTVADLQAQIAAGADVPPEVIAAANRVSAATAELDALNPDA
jgi:N-acetylmuramic acid 6-phosphate (MurNAc-6-P) etherase